MGVVYPLRMGAKLSKHRFRFRRIPHRTIPGRSPVPAKALGKIELGCVHLFRFLQLVDEFSLPVPPAFAFSLLCQLLQAQFRRHQVNPVGRLRF